MKTRNQIPHFGHYALNGAALDMSDALPSPVLTIVSITLNDKSGLEETICSVQAQTSGEGIEHVIVDGLSDYDVAGLLSELGSGAKLIAERDAGLYDAMNKGISAATGEYVIFLNSGDSLASEEVLANFFAIIANDKPDLIYGDSLEKLLTGGIVYKKSRKMKTLAYGMITHHQSMVFRREIIEANRILYDLNYPIAADYNFFLQFHEHATSCIYLPEPIAMFQSGGISQTRPEQGCAEQYLVRQSFYGSALFARYVWLLQRGLWILRRNAPWAYWVLKRK